MPNGLISRMDKHYQNPDKFLPERWIRGCEQRENVNPYVTLPFGHGARKCVGMRFASLELELVAAKVCKQTFLLKLVQKLSGRKSKLQMVRQFQWNYNYGEMSYRTFFVHVPMDPLKFQVTDRLN